MVSKQLGFTVIELLVVIAVITILPTIVIVNFPSIRLEFALSRAAHKFAQDLRNAQDKAISSVRYMDASGNPQWVGGYGVYINTSTLGQVTYLVYADGPPANQQYDALDYIIETIDVAESGVIIQRLENVLPPSVSINFAPPNPVTTIVPNPSQGYVNVVFALPSDWSKTRTVSINTAGLIEVK